MRQHLGLLIGVGQYPFVGPQAELLGPSNDATALARVLVQNFGFRRRDLRVLLDAEATRRGILNAWDELVEAAGNGDQVVLHFSGHGSQVADLEGHEPDGLDETLVPFDSHRERAGECADITDDELALRLARLDKKGVFVTLILDCCHAGHAHRWRPDIRIRGLPPSQAPRRQKVRFREGSLFTTSYGRRVVLAACREDQRAGERAVTPGRHHGDWTWALLRALHEGGTGTVGEVFERARRRLTQSNPDQWPELHGERDRMLFGRESVDRPHFRRVHRREDGRWMLDMGAVHGLREGSRWAWRRQGEDLPSSPSTEVKVVAVEAFRSEVEVVGGEDGPSVDLSEFWAQEVEPAYGDARLPVALAEPQQWDEELWEQVRRGVEGSPVLRVWSRQGSSPLGDPWVEIWPDLSIRSVLGQPLPSSPLPGGSRLERLFRRLEQRAWARHALGLTNRDPVSELRTEETSRLNFQLLRRSQEGSWQRVPTENGLGQVTHGDVLSLQVRHELDTGLYLYIFNVGLTDRLTQIHPDEGATEFLYPGIELNIGRREGDELEVRFPEELNAQEGLGFLKLFLTTSPVDFRWLTHPRFVPVVQRAGSRLESLLSMGQVGAYREQPGDWTTCQIGLQVHRQRVHSGTSFRRTRRGRPG